MSARTPEQIALALSEPFEPNLVHWKPQSVSGNRALAIAYVDARVIQDRLDSVLGVDGWQDDYECLEDGSVVCRLRLRFGNEWITKVDVGSQSEQADEGDRRKAAFSDALKRVAVKFGIGRYLYRLPSQWCDWDAKARRFVKQPALPAWALPRGESKPQPAPQPPLAPPAKEPEPKARTLPRDGLECESRLYERDLSLAEEGLILQGDLLTAVATAVTKAGGSPDVRQWTEKEIALAASETKRFIEQARAKQARKQTTLNHISGKGA